MSLGFIKREYRNFIEKTRRQVHSKPEDTPNKCYNCPAKFLKHILIQYEKNRL